MNVPLMENKFLVPNVRIVQIFDFFFKLVDPVENPIRRKYS